MNLYSVILTVANQTFSSAVFAENHDQAVIFVRDNLRKVGFWGKASNVKCIQVDFDQVVGMHVGFEYNGKARQGEVLEAGPGWMKIDQNSSHPKTFSLEKVTSRIDILQTA